MAATGIPATLSLATEPLGEATGHPAHLMTLVTGSPDETRTDDASLAAIADLLASIHRVVATPTPRGFRRTAFPTWRYGTVRWRDSGSLRRTAD